jgi:hypothetical protein
MDPENTNSLNKLNKKKNTLITSSVSAVAGSQFVFVGQTHSNSVHTPAISYNEESQSHMETSRGGYTKLTTGSSTFEGESSQLRSSSLFAQLSMRSKPITVRK